MSDSDAAPDPVDKAYARAEASLDDEAMRAMRRARVLDAVLSRAGPEQVRLGEPVQQVRFRQGRRWLAAASVVGLASFVALRLDPPPEVRQRPSATDSLATAAEPFSVAAATPDAVESRPSLAPATSTDAPSIVAEAQTRASSDVAVEGSSPLPPSAEAPAPPAPSTPAAAGADAGPASEVVVTGARAEPPHSAARARTEPAAGAVGTTAAAPAVSESRLWAAAAAGRVGEVTRLLDQGAPIDEPDAAGETALMKSIRARQSDTAALLRRRGASLDQRNSAGVSAREIAAAIGDRKLNEALGLP